MTKLMMCAAALLLFGCQGSGSGGKVTVGDTLDVLRAGEARGHLVVTTGGSPLSIGAKTILHAGPESATLAFDGEVDFSTHEPTNP